MDGQHHIEANYLPTHEEITLEEHIVNVEYDSGGYVLFDNKRYLCVQFHLHTPSEHLIPHELKDSCHYVESLTTPPYTETVHWAMLGNIMEGNNARYIQLVNGRRLEIVNEEMPEAKQ